MKTLHLSITVVVLIIMLLSFNTTFAQNATNSTNSIPPNAIRTPNGGWITPLQTHDANGTKLNIHYEVGTPVYGKVPPPVPNFITQYMLSPLNQFKSGTAVKDIKCKENLQLIIKSEDGSPVCVKPSTQIILEQRGWTLPITQPNKDIMYCQKNPSNACNYTMELWYDDCMKTKLDVSSCHDGRIEAYLKANGLANIMLVHP